MRNDKQRWLSEYKGKPLPKGVRIRQGKGGALRLYVRCTNESGKQREIITPWHATDKDGIALAVDRYHEIRLGIRRQRDAQAAAPATPPRSLGPKEGTLSECLALEFEWWSRERGRERSAADQRAWETTAKTITRIMGPDTRVADLTRNDILEFIQRRVSETIRGRTCSYDTVFRNIQVLRSAIQRAQALRRVPADWAILWPRRSDFAAQASKTEQEGHFIDRETLEKFLIELDRDSQTGPERSDYTRVISLMFKMALATGLRAAELERLRVKDVQASQIFIHGKYGAPHWSRAYGELPHRIALKVIAVRGLRDQPDALLFGKSNSRTLMYAHTQVARRVSERMGLALPIKLRDMRATSARWKYDGHKDGPAGVSSQKDIEAAKAWLRHADISMTVKYLRVANARPVQEIDDFLLP